MFTGIGGFELGIQYANRSSIRGSKENTPGNEGEGLLPSTRQDIGSTDGRASERPDDFSDERPLCVGYSEIDKYAIQTFEHHFGKEVKNYGDATKLNTSELPDFDLLVGGFPCQAFSLAGKRAGFEDTRGTLIFDVVRVLRDKRPRHFVLENVKGLLSHEGGKTFAAILEILTDSGYDVSWSIHNSKNYGTPQNRERVYLIGNLRGERRPQVFPLSESNRPFNEPNTETRTIARTVTATYQKGGNGTHLLQTPRGKNRGGFKSIAATVTSKSYQHNNHVALDEGTSIRRLTPVECERLQGFPDGWTLGSDSQRYKQCGNAITVNVVEHVVRSLYETNND